MAGRAGEGFSGRGEMGQVGRHQDTGVLKPELLKLECADRLGSCQKARFHSAGLGGTRLCVSNKLPDVMLLLQGPHFDRKPVSHAASLD